MAMTITRTTDTRYTVTTHDGRRDDAMYLDGAVLRPADEPGFIRIAAGFRMTLGPISYGRIRALAVGATIELAQTGPVQA